MSSFIAALRDAGETVVEQIGSDDVPASHIFDREICREAGRWKVVPRKSR
jgi:hypothetical protein